MLRPWMGKLYVQVLIGIFIGLLLGLLTPDIAVTLQPLADGFIKLIKMLLAPIIFGTVVLGMAKMGNITEVGRIGVRALIYFEVVSTIALVIGLVVVNVVQPGVGMNIDLGRIDAGAISGFTKTAESQGGTVQFFLDIIPNTIVDAFAKGAMLQVIFIFCDDGDSPRPDRRKRQTSRGRDPLTGASTVSVCVDRDAVSSHRRGRGRSLHDWTLRRGLADLPRLANAVCLHNITRVYSRYTREYRAVVWFSAVTFSSLLQR